MSNPTLCKCIKINLVLNGRPLRKQCFEVWIAFYALNLVKPEVSEFLISLMADGKAQLYVAD